MAQLAKRIDSLRSEKAATAKKQVKLHVKLSNLKESNLTRAKAFEEDREAINKSKVELEHKRDDCELQTDTAITKLRQLQESIQLKAKEQGESSQIVDGTVEEEAQNSKAVIAELAAQAIELRHKAQVSEEDAYEAEMDKVKLEQKLTDMIAEFGKLETFSQNLQARYEAIQQWYEVFHSWNEKASCDACKQSLDIGAIIDAAIEEKAISAPSNA